MDNSEAKVFLDNCVRSDSVIARPTTFRKTVQWGSSEIEVDVVGWRGQPPKQPWLQEQIDCLPTIAALVRNGRIRFFTYNELRFEAWHARGGGFSVFEGLPLTPVPAPLERSRLFIHSDFKRTIHGSETAAFAKFLLYNMTEPLAAQLIETGVLTEFEVQNLKQLGRFREICAGLSAKHHRDALHLWTAEVNGMDYFLTTELKFRRALAQKKDFTPRCKIVSPSDLLSELGVSEREPLPFEPGEEYDYFGRPLGKGGSEEA